MDVESLDYKYIEENPMDKNKSKLSDDIKIRDAFPILKTITYLNVGTYGVMPEPALAEFQLIQAEFERSGVASNGSFGRKAEDTRNRVASLIGADVAEIAFTRNATDGINLVLAGIDWMPGDEIITTDEEHEAMNHPLLYLQRIKGIQVKRVGVSPHSDVMVERLQKVLTNRTRLVAMSLITCETGTRLPAQAISSWASEMKLLTLFDGAQASGAFPVNVKSTGCDFYASNGHKWLCGPKGTGFFYGKREKLETLIPAHVGAGSLEQADITNGTAEPFHTGQRFEFGTRAWSLYAGLGFSLDWFEGIGWTNVYSQIEALSDYLKDGIQRRPYLKLITPHPFIDSSGLTSFIFEGHNAHDVSHVLREKWHIYVRVVPHFNAIRISTAHFNNNGDIDRLFEALDQIKD
jgi:selenocysteine lyase/cysteine desulfurase